MGDISEAITILADKVGIGVDTLYQLNLSIQTIKAVSNIVTLISMIVLIIISAIIIYIWDNRYQVFDGAEGKAFIFGMVLVVIVLGCLFFQACIEETALRIFAPQYMAMKDTISMIGGMI